MSQDLVHLLQPLLGGVHAMGVGGSRAGLLLFAESLAGEDKIRTALDGVADPGQVTIGGDLDTPRGRHIGFRIGGQPVEVTVHSVAHIDRIIADYSAGRLPSESTDSTALADLASIRPLADPHGLLARWREQLATSPAALRDAVIAQPEVSERQRLTLAEPVAETRRPVEPDPHTLSEEAGADTPEVVVERQLAAYNAHDLEAFLATYAEDVELERGDEVFVGIEAMRARYGPIFAAGRCRAVISARMRQGEWIVDHETAYGLGPEPVEVLVAYRVRGGVIDRVRFMA